MATISILPETSTHGTKFRAVAGQYHSLGQTPGEALDAISQQLNEDESGTLLVVQHMRGDRFFSEKQRKRLAELMDQWRTARDQGTPFPDQAELDQLMETELKASLQRSLTLRDANQP